MSEPDVALSVVVPAYRCADSIAATATRLLEFLRGTGVSFELLIVDDGSTDGTADRVDELTPRSPGLVSIRQSPNQGKGAAVRTGVRRARGRRIVFLDADLAYPPDQIARILEALDRGHDVASASRVLPESRFTMSPLLFPYVRSRYRASRVLNRMIRTLRITDVLDTQAGLKGFTREAAAAIFERVSLPGFGFDIEIFAIAARRGLSVAQVPVHFEYQNAATTTRFLRDAVRMIADLLRVLYRKAAGRYDP